MARPLYSRRGRSRILSEMDPTPTSRLRQPFVMFACAVLLLVGAGIAGARTQGGPPWAQDGSCDATETTQSTGTTGATGATGTTEADDADDGADEAGRDACETESDGAAGGEDVGDEVVTVDDEPVQADVEDYLATFGNDCGAAFLGEFDLGDEDSLVAFDDLVSRLDAGQTSHGVQSVRVLLGNCEDHPNDGLMNALYHHGLNWVKHSEHEQRLQEKFANKWPEGKPGNAEHGHGNAETAQADRTHGNPHTSSSGNPHTSSSGSSSHGNGHGHSN
jgi:hypothetical protein